MMENQNEHHPQLQEHDHHTQLQNHEHHPQLQEHDIASSHQQVPLENWNQSVLDQYGGLKKTLIDFHRHYLDFAARQREKLLVEVTEKLHEEFLADEEKTRNELCQQFKEELDTTKEDLEKKYQDQLRGELNLLDDKHRKDLASVKKQQWCWQCEKEAIYPCCWNTAYCCVECQQAHWPNHKKYCRRKKGGQK